MLLDVKPLCVDGDDRARWCEARLNGTKYGYLLSVPANGKFKETIFLLHGFPDLSFAWRYQIPYLRALGYRVVAPDMIGYGRTDSYAWTKPNEHKYSYKQAAEDMRALAKLLGAKKIVLGGHDWGGVIAHRMALHMPYLVSHVFTVATPYFAPTEHYVDVADLVERDPRFKSLRYQLQFRSGVVEKVVQTEGDLKKFLNAMLGGKTWNEEFGFTAQEGLLVHTFKDTKRSPLVSEKELDYHTREQARNGIHGPLNYYRNDKINHKDDQELLGCTIEVPVLFIGCEKDVVLKPDMWAGMEEKLPKLTMRSINAGHWALIEKPTDVNETIGMWLRDVVEGSKVKL
ncbi:hypothetical protein KEM55_005176 [Ascosphaera atra]|nr:hypothetical protein KEM55_005176 [Ascosphaera atra]